ncbi:hypothetical protein BJF80_04300 [Serinicoccus sp. CUA-874]|uniref:DUF4235 domain-containing protein n=1 Tax=Serinicoccus sp. CUA-874 TaxID=1517939 RepID=UPI000968B8D7|nr:DUF4235 domain-containing protein [Serinicoccus sp. CUA-874]OLT16593.1 hypothetical protein BJF80_04300 [Serinicoccus sp. CUA-874]OLT24941.1 hypothetical protein BJF82_13055 [Kytococcus sp. CUA-901]
MGNLVAKAMTVGAVLAASSIARKATDGTWKFVTGNDSPTNPEDPDIDFKEAVAFAVLSGALVGLARMLANRESTKVIAKASRKSSEQIADETN